MFQLLARRRTQRRRCSRSCDVIVEAAEVLGVKWCPRHSGALSEVNACDGPLSSLRLVVGRRLVRDFLCYSLSEWSVAVRRTSLVSPHEALPGTLSGKSTSRSARSR